MNINKTEQKNDISSWKYQDRGDRELVQEIRKTLQKVYDPEFPLVDMETLGLFYAVDGEKEQKKITITMTFTTPACPMGDLITEMVKNELKKVFTDWKIQIEITFEPLWTPKMIKDQDLQRMFE